MFNLFPNNYTYQETDEALIVQYGVMNVKSYTFEKMDHATEDLDVIKYHIHSLHSLVLLAVPLMAFIVVGSLLQFSKWFGNIKGITTSKKRIVAFLLMTLIIVLWFTGEFIHRIENIEDSIRKLI